MHQDSNTQLNTGKALKLIGSIIQLVGIGSAAAFAIMIFANFLAQPVLSYNPKTSEFTTPYEFRGITMRVYPQMMIRVGNDVLIMSHLNGYFEQETLHFKEGKAIAKEDHQEYCNGLFDYIRESVLSKVREMYGNDLAEEVKEQLDISVTFLGSVRYQTRLGNYMHQYCIFENNGLLVDVKKDAKIIWKRLYETNITLHDNLGEIVWDEQVEAVIASVAEEIGGLHGIRMELPKRN